MICSKKSSGAPSGGAAALDAVPSGSAAGAAAEVRQQCPACTCICEGHPTNCGACGTALAIVGAAADVGCTFATTATYQLLESMRRTLTIDFCWIQAQTQQSGRSPN